MKLARLAASTRKLAIDNSPQLLSAVGVAGVVTTAVLTGKASYRAHEILSVEVQAQNNVNGYELTPRDKVQLTWKLYVPPVASAGLTIAAIVGASRISASRAAGLAAAFSLSERAYQEYQEKVIEKLGPRKEQAARDDIARDRIARDSSQMRDVVVVGTDVMCFDAYSGRYFKSSMEELKKAQNDLNYTILSDGYASLTDLYEKIGLSRTGYSDEVGWTSEMILDMSFSTILSDDGRPCIAVEFKVRPVRHYHKFH